MVRSEPHVVGLDDLVRVEETVFGREDVPAVAGQFGVRGGLLEQSRDVDFAGRRRPLSDASCVEGMTSLNRAATLTHRGWMGICCGLS